MEEWYSAKEIRDIINSSNINDKEVKTKRIQQLLKKIQSESDPKLFKTKKDQTHKGKGPKPLKYNKNFLFKIRDYYQKNFYTYNSELYTNEINKNLITPNTIDSYFTPTIKYLFRDAVDQEDKLKRKLYENQRKLSNYFDKTIEKYEKEYQQQQQTIFFHKYKENLIKTILSIKKIRKSKKLELIEKASQLTNIEDTAVLLQQVKLLRFQKDKLPKLK